MKKPLSLLFAVACGAAATTPRASFSQENPNRDRPAAERPAPEERIPLGWPDDKRRDGPRNPGQRGAREGAQMRMTSFIGVITREVAPEVRAHVGLPEGFGLMVAEVLPDSPAQAAGIQAHDILITLGDQRLAHVDQLMALVRERKKGDPIVLTLKRAGAEQKVTVTVSEKNMPVASTGDFRGPGISFWGGGPDGDRRFQFHVEGNRGPGEAMGDLHERIENLRRMAEQYRDRLQEWASGPRDKPMPEVPRFDAPGRREDGAGKSGDGERKENAGPGFRTSTQVESKVEVRGGANSTMFQSHVTRRDDSGEYSLRTENGKTTFTVRPKEGKEESFDVTTPAQREALPAPVRDKLRETEKSTPAAGGGSPPPPPDEPKRDAPPPGGKGTI